MGESSSILLHDRLKLWAKAGGQCAYPACTTDLTDACEAALLGNIAHIVAKNLEGPRGFEKPIGGINTYPNLILLCENHHSLVDKDHARFPVESLLEMKRAHEERISKRLQGSKPWMRKWEMIHYINVPRLGMISAQYGQAFVFSPESRFTSLNDLSMELADLIQTVQSVMERIEIQAHWLHSLKTVDSSLQGQVVYFSERFYGKNIPAPHLAGTSCLTGRIEDDPHLHFKVGKRKVMLAINPKWITTDTAFGDFIHRGRSHVILSGIFQIKSVNEDGSVIFGSPLLLGLCKRPPGVHDEHQ